MTDYNKMLTPGDVDNGIVNVVVEIPAGSNNKIEWNRDEEVMQLDRIESDSEPANYGFIPQTLNDDGDELDAIVIGNPLSTETFVKARIIGVMKFEDEGKSDDKIIVVPENITGKFAHINTIDDIQKNKIDEIVYHFSHSKDYDHGVTVVKGWGDIEAAKKVIRKAIKRWDENKD